jgi:hypothetical protein
MTSVRRQIVRPAQTPQATDSRISAITRRRRDELAKNRAALHRWLTRLKRAANTVTALHRRIGRLEATLASGG